MLSFNFMGTSLTVSNTALLVEVVPPRGKMCSYSRTPRGGRNAFFLNFFIRLQYLP